MAVEKSLTHEQFELCRPLLYRISKERQAIAYDVLVKKMSPSVVSANSGISRQLLNHLTNNVMGKFEKLKSEGAVTPGGWVTETFFAPANVILELKKVYNQAMNINE